MAKCYPPPDWAHILLRLDLSLTWDKVNRETNALCIPSSNSCGRRYYFFIFSIRLYGLGKKVCVAMLYFHYLGCDWLFRIYMLLYPVSFLPLPGNILLWNTAESRTEYLASVRLNWNTSICCVYRIARTINRPFRANSLTEFAVRC